VVFASSPFREALFPSDHYFEDYTLASVRAQNSFPPRLQLRVAFRPRPERPLCAAAGAASTLCAAPNLSLPRRNLKNTFQKHNGDTENAGAPSDLPGNHGAPEIVLRTRNGEAHDVADDSEFAADSRGPQRTQRLRGVSMTSL